LDTILTATFSPVFYAKSLTRTLISFILTLLTPSFTTENAPLPNSLANMYALLNFLPVHEIDAVKSKIQIIAVEDRTFIIGFSIAGSLAITLSHSDKRLAGEFLCTMHKSNYI
jgi:hypothetical protein